MFFKLREGKKQKTKQSLGKCSVNVGLLYVGDVIKLLQSPTKKGTSGHPSKNTEVWKQVI